MQAPPDVIGDRPDGDQVGCIEQQLRVSLEDLAARSHPLGQRLNRERASHHAFHPFAILCQTSSALRPASGVVTMRVGHGRVNPSDAHLRVASMPILLP